MRRVSTLALTRTIIESLFRTAASKRSGSEHSHLRVSSDDDSFSEPPGEFVGATAGNVVL
jgi:hypothetical protein